MDRREWGGRGSPPAPSLEALWAQYGAWLERHVAEALGDDGGVREACYLTMVDAGRRILEGEFPRSSSNLWPWFEQLAADACRRVRAGDYDEAAISEGPMPRALPAPLRAAVRRRRMREWLDRRFGGFAAVGLVPEVVVRARDWCGRVARSAWRRAGALVPSGAPNTTGAFGVALGSGVSEAVAAAAVAVILGMGGGGVAGATAHAAEVRSARPEPISTSSVAEEVEPGFESSSAASSGDASAGDPRSVADATPPDDDGVETVTPVQPEVRTETKGGPEEPVRQQHHDGGTEYVTPEASTTADLEGDDAPEAVVQPPIVFLDCPEPEDRGVTHGAVCPLVDDSSEGEG